MKSRLSYVLSFLAFSFAASAPAVMAQDMGGPPPADAPATPPPAPSDQPPPPPPPKKGGGRRPPMGYDLAALTDQLKLTADQQAKVGDIIKDQKAAGKEIREDTSLSDDDKRSKSMALMKSTHDKIRALLTDDQQTQFDALPVNQTRKKKQAAE